MAINLEMNNRSKVYCVVAGLALFAFGVYNWAISPQTSYIKAATQHGDMTGQLDRKIDYMAKLKGIKAGKLEELQVEVQGLEKLVFTAGTADAFFSELEAMMAEHGCKIKSMVFLQGNEKSFKKLGKNEEPVASIAQSKSAEIMFVSNFGGIVNIIRKLESNKKQTTVENLRVESKQAGSSVLTCNMTVTVYVLK